MRLITTLILLLKSVLIISQIDIQKELLHFDSLKFNNVKILKSDTIIEKNDNLFITHFYYGQYNLIGFIVWHEKNNTFDPLWYQLDSIGSPPHTFSFIDFNQDDKTDLFLLDGEDDYYHTSAYINYSADHYLPTNFQMKYENKNDYSILVDIDKDGKPEILDSGHSGDEHNESPLLLFTTKQKKELSDNYDSITNNKIFNNFTYNMPDQYKIFNSFITDKIIIYQFINGSFIDNTVNFKDYIDWRINFLTELKKDTKNDNMLIDNTIEYLKDKVK